MAEPLFYMTLPSNPSFPWISRGEGMSFSFPSRTARRHWWMQMYCCSVWTIQTCKYQKQKMVLPCIKSLTDTDCSLGEPTLSLRMLYTIPKISTMSDFRICCRIRSRAMKVPDRPTPALQWTTMGRTRSSSGWTRSRNARTNLTRVWGGSGTPKSGHVVKWKCFIRRHVSP